LRFDFRAHLAARRLQLQNRTHELGVRAERFLRGQRERWERLHLQLQERSPLRVLERGYAIATDAAGKVLRDAAQVAVGDEVRVQLHRGRLRTEVKDKSS
jgi:exodeoxyribonuclease VII large subunit